MHPHDHDTPGPPYPPAAAAPTRWRSTLVGAAAGGLLAASVAVPATWLLTHDDPAPPSTTAQVQPPGWGTSGRQAVPQDRDDTSGATSTDADDTESQGVVLVDTTLTDGEAAGTGLVIDPAGLVLTNYHVVEGSTSVRVTIATDGTTYDATVVGHDQRADVALLRLDGVSDLATAVLDDDGDPAVGDTVTAIGNAEGQGHLSASSGDVVALDQAITTSSSGSVAGERLTGLIETDAYVVGGYSGGALLDDEGEVVGITTAASGGSRSASTAESYAVPIDDALAVADQIESGTESGDVEIGPSAYLGVAVDETGTGDGVGVVEVQDGTAADRAGLAAGDVLTRVGAARVTSLATLRAAMAAHEPGDRTSLRWTDSTGTTHSATVTLGSAPTS